MNFAELIKTVLAMPGGSIVYAKRTDEASSPMTKESEYKIENVNGQKVTDAN